MAHVVHNDAPFQFIPRCLEDDFKKREKLRAQYQNSFIDAVSKVFAPETQTLIFKKCEARDTRIWAKSEAEINRNQAIAPPEMHYMIQLKANLEVLTILCEEYRDGYFALMNLVGVKVFEVIGDRNRQRDGVIEAEGARLDNMLERVSHAAQF